MAGLRKNEDSVTPIQGFAPRSIVTITATVAWAPTPKNMFAFRVPVACNYYLSTTGAGHETGLLAGSITVINRDVASYVFDTTMEIEVM
jgi:hypothetical protein